MTYYAEIAALFIKIVVNLLLIGTPISIGVFIVLRLTRDAAPRARYLLTLIAFVAAAVLPFVVMIAPTKGPQPHHTIVNTSRGNDGEVPGKPQSAGTLRTEILSQSETGATSVSLLDSLVRFFSWPSLSVALFTLWLTGACFLLSREAASHLRVVRARKQWIPAGADLRERLSWPKDTTLVVDNDFGPCALGVFNSVVVGSILRWLMAIYRESSNTSPANPLKNSCKRTCCALLV